MLSLTSRGIVLIEAVPNRSCWSALFDSLLLEIGLQLFAESLSSSSDSDSTECPSYIELSDSVSDSSSPSQDSQSSSPEEFSSSSSDSVDLTPQVEDGLRVVEDVLRVEVVLLSGVVGWVPVETGPLPFSYRT